MTEIGIFMWIGGLAVKEVSEEAEREASRVMFAREKELAQLKALQAKYPEAK